MARPGIKGLTKVMSSFYFAPFGVFPVKTVILANVRPFRDKLIYSGCLFNPFMPEEFLNTVYEFSNYMRLLGDKLVNY